MTQETMLEQIRRLNEQAALAHAQRREAALEKIRLMRRAQREQQELNHRERYYETRS